MTRLIALFAVIVLLAMPRAASAQTHYCDTTPPTSGTVVAGATLTVQVCAPKNDSAGNPTVVGAWALYDNGTRTTPTFTPGTTSPISGMTVYTLNVPPISVPGAHTLQAAIVNGGEGGKGTPFALTVTPALPGVPTNLTVK